MGIRQQRTGGQIFIEHLLVAAGCPVARRQDRIPDGPVEAQFRRVPGATEFVVGRPVAGDRIDKYGGFGEIEAVADAGRNRDADRVAGVSSTKVARPRVGESERMSLRPSSMRPEITTR